jgi:hypothetical protein
MVKVHGRERVKTEAGEFDCLVVEPILRGPGIFTQKGRITVWLTDDARRMPVQIRSKLKTGTLVGRLEAFDRGNQPPPPTPPAPTPTPRAAASF